MGSVIRQLCFISLLCGFLLSICPEGNIKQIAGILSSVILILTVLTPLKAFDFDIYAEKLAEYTEKEKALSERSTEMSERLNRLVIEREYAAYIQDKAEEKGIEVKEAEVQVQWSSEGCWVPYSAEIYSNAANPLKYEMIQLIEADLGIPEERQRWYGSE